MPMVFGLGYGRKSDTLSHELFRSAKRLESITDLIANNQIAVPHLQSHLQDRNRLCRGFISIALSPNLPSSITRRSIPTNQYRDKSPTRIGIAFVKTSYLLLYHRIFPAHYSRKSHTGTVSLCQGKGSLVCDIAWAEIRIMARQGKLLDRMGLLRFFPL